MKRLYKSNNRMLCGVCAGIAEYFGIDPTIVRLIWAALALSGTGFNTLVIRPIARASCRPVLKYSLAKASISASL